jgi:phosphonate transport system substrate-binding protein
MSSTRSRPGRRLLSAAFLLLLLGTQGGATAAEPPAPLPAQLPQAGPPQAGLRLGVFPRRGAEATLEAFGPLARYLERRLGRPVALETSYDFRSFQDALATRPFDLLHSNQYHYVRAHAQQGYRAILKNRENGSGTLRAVILARRDSGIRALTDLRGQKVIFGGGRDAMVSYIAPTHLLREAGLAEGDYLSTFALNPPEACTALYFGQGAAAAVGEAACGLMPVKGRIDPGRFVTLAAGEPLAQLPWAVPGDQAPDLTSALVAALTGLEREIGRAHV